MDRADQESKKLWCAFRPFHSPSSGAGWLFMLLFRSDQYVCKEIYPYHSSGRRDILVLRWSQSFLESSHIAILSHLASILTSFSSSNNKLTCVLNSSGLHSLTVNFQVGIFLTRKPGLGTIYNRITLQQDTPCFYSLLCSINIHFWKILI